MRYEKYYIGNTSEHKGLFEQLRGKEAAPNRVSDGDVNMVNETSTNNGITKKASSNFVFTAPAITVSVNYAQTVFLQIEDFCASVNILILKSDWLTKTPEAGLYIIAHLIKNNQKYDYSCKISKDRLNDTILILPTLDEVDKTSPYSDEGFIPDWEYMQERIAELEQERIAELEQYLVATGLNDYELTEEDKEVLAFSFSWKKFRLDELFKKVKTKKIYGKANDFPTCKTSEYAIPLLTAGADNQGFARYAKRNQCPTILKNVISISANGANTGITFYQKDEFAVLQDAYAIKLKDMEIPNEQVGLFLASCINKILYGNFSWTYKAGWERIKDLSIKLPVKESEEIDWDFMTKYIRAIEKVVIADVVNCCLK